ncbi:MAG: prepilin-type N-terminal cleavage/methylation domain-containing protein [Sodalis sp. (in: enterobacteria)]|uniref:prepilin-type N-terminal cleavage/methylation domain-containing protein n=1 Tax=Sodalis sp. (in: enterobacteria) TaxID=1898979 RepID=UPI0039E3DFD3
MSDKRRSATLARRWVGTREGWRSVMLARRRDGMRDRRRRRVPDPQRGAGLVEALLETMLLAITALGLLEYSQRLAVFQRRLQDVSLALSLNHQRLELLRQPAAPDALSQPPGWRINVIEESCDEDCRRVTAMVTLPSGERISLNEWVCQNPAGITGT